MARFYQSQIVEPISTFAPLPLEFMQNNLDKLQAKKDAHRAKIDAINTDILSRQEDKPDAIKKAKELNDRIERLKGYDINFVNPNEKQNLLKEMKDINFELSNYGEKNAYESRLKQEEAIKKSIEEDKDATGENAWLKDWYNKDLSIRNSRENNPVNYNPQTGQFNQIKAPEKLKPVKIQEEVKNVFADLENDSRYTNSGYINSGVDFVKDFREGKVTEYKFQKTANVLLNRIANPENIKYYQAKSISTLGTDENGKPLTDERNFALYDEREKIKDEKTGREIDNPNKGKFIGFNTNTLLGKELQGALTGKVNRLEDLSTDHVRDTFNEEKQGKKDDLTDSFGSSITESGANFYETVPEVLKKWIDNSGTITLEGMKKRALEVGKDYKVMIDGKSYNYDNLPKGYSFTQPMSKEGTMYLKTPSGKLQAITYDTRRNDEKIKENLTILNNEVNKLADRYGVVGESFEDVANKVLTILNKNAVTVSKNVELDGDIAERITNKIVGDDKQASQLSFVDIYDGDHSKKISAQEYLTRHKIDKNSLNMLDYDFTAREPGTKTFTAKDTDGVEKVIRITTRNVTEQNHFKPAYTVIQNLQKFNQNKEVEYKKTNDGFIAVGEIETDFDGTSVQAVYDPKTKEQYIAKQDTEGKTVLYPIDTYKQYVTNKYFVEGGGKEYLRGIKNKYGNLNDGQE